MPPKPLPITEAPATPSPQGAAKPPIAKAPITKAPITKQKPHFSGHRKRLRDRFMQTLGQGMPDYEILEMLLFAAHPRGDVKPLAKRLIARFGSLQGVIGATPEALMEVEGSGDAVAASIKLVGAACERFLASRIVQQTVLSRWDELLDYCRMSMGHLKEEQFRIFFLNKANVLIANELQQKGTVDHAPVYVRNVIKRALELNATAIILCHNHPSGLARPSKADVDITKNIIEAGAPLGVIVHDHVIITQTGHYSLRANGLL